MSDTPEQSQHSGSTDRTRGLIPWKKGQSGNPAGRAKGIEAMCREHTPEAIAALVRALHSDDERVSVTAATVLIERGWGKVPPAPSESNETAVSYVIRGPAPVGSTQEWLRLHVPQSVDHTPGNAN